MFDVAVSVTGWDPVFGIAFAMLFLTVSAYAKAVPQGDRRWWLLLLLLALLLLPSPWLGSTVARVVLTDAAAFVAVGLVWARGTPDAGKAARTYLSLLIPSVLCIVAGLLLIGETTVAPTYPLDRLAAGLLLVGFGLKLALIPFYVWLPGVARSASPMTTALILSIVDIAAFGELVHLRETSPWLFAGNRELWLSLALLSMFGGALLALAQRELKLMLAFSTVDDMGYLLLGIAAGPEIGVAGALLSALSHSLVKIMLFGAVGLAEHQLGRALTLEDRGLACRFPASGAAFIAGALAMVGMPPFFGFAGRWRLYLAGAGSGGPWLVLAMATATVLALLYYMRAIHLVWLGPKTAGETGGEPRLAAAVLVALTVVALSLGIAPGLVSGLVR